MTTEKQTADVRKNLVSAQVYKIKKGTPEWMNFRRKMLKINPGMPVHKLIIFIICNFDDGTSTKTILGNRSESDLVNYLKELPLDVQRGLMWFAINSEPAEEVKKIKIVH